MTVFSEKFADLLHRRHFVAKLSHISALLNFSDKKASIGWGFGRATSDFRSKNFASLEGLKTKAAQRTWDRAARSSGPDLMEARQPEPKDSQPTFG